MRRSGRKAPQSAPTTRPRAVPKQNWTNQGEPALGWAWRSWGTFRRGHSTLGLLELAKLLSTMRETPAGANRPGPEHRRDEGAS